MQFRGGSSKGVYLAAADVPVEPVARDRLLLDLMGRGERQIDGLGGADPLTSKVAIVGPASREDADVDFLFAQVVVGTDSVDVTPNCGNILAGVGPYAVESGLVVVHGGTTVVRVHMVNSGKLCELQLSTPDGAVEYAGDARIDGVPGTASAVLCHYLDVAGAICGALLPTGNVIDVIDDIEVTCVDNGMPVIVVRAEDLGVSGYESPDELNANDALRQRIESLRLQAGPQMNLGDVSAKAVPKISLVSPALHGGLVNTRTFIPHRCHAAVGVLGAVSVATACIIPGAVTSEFITVPPGASKQLSVEHPSGEFSVTLEVDESADMPVINKAGVLRTARLLSRGTAYVPVYNREESL